jgi:ADP-dependent NAD(P)H-hydrate dehydratase / NAD(P)H-hydrate epimerase
MRHRSEGCLKYDAVNSIATSNHKPKTMNFYNPPSIYEMDRAATKLDSLSSKELMQRAGSSLWKIIGDRWPSVDTVTIFIGSGNNGGDGLVAALEACRQGVDVQLVFLGTSECKSDTVEYYWQQCVDADIEIESWQAQTIRGSIIIDALLGIGIDRELSNEWIGLIKYINQLQQPIIAADIPSGLNARTGVAMPLAVCADITVTFIARKCGQKLADGPDYCGELILDNLGVSRLVKQQVYPALVETPTTDWVLPDTRPKNSHKHRFGHVFVIGGEAGMAGAVMLAARAALRSGAGVVSCYLDPNGMSNIKGLDTPELMIRSWDDLEANLANADVLLAGPGIDDLTQHPKLVELIQETQVSVVIDAGALRSEFIASLGRRRCVLTPHPGEAAGLLNTSNRLIQLDRQTSIQKLVDQFHKTTVLKGSGTLIAEPKSKVKLVTRGNPALASAGTGDVLAGIIAAFLAQGLSCLEAAETGVVVHSVCADRYVETHDETGLLARDIIELIPIVMKSIRQGLPEC